MLLECLKSCCGCRQSKPLSEYHKDNSRADGRRIICKACVSKNNPVRAARTKELRHQRGISKFYWQNGSRKRLTDEQRVLNKKLTNKVCRTQRRGIKRATREDIQFVYELNIKAHGTLTCYLCIKPIIFGDDHLEHKIPISRGGSNHRDNLDVAHKRCNLIKHDKTYEEFLKCAFHF